MADHYFEPGPRIDGRFAPDEPPTCPPEHPHSTNCYTVHKCRCRACRASWSAARRKQYRDAQARGRKRVEVSAGPIVRRLRALAVIGYSCKEIASKVGVSSENLLTIRRGENRAVQMSVAAKVIRFYSESWNVPSAHPNAHLVASRARTKNYQSPLHWTDINKGIVAIDDDAE